MLFTCHLCCTVHVGCMLLVVCSCLCQVCVGSVVCIGQHCDHVGIMLSVVCSHQWCVIHVGGVFVFAVFVLVVCLWWQCVCFVHIGSVFVLGVCSYWQWVRFGGVLFMLFMLACVLCCRRHYTSTVRRRSRTQTSSCRHRTNTTTLSTPVSPVMCSGKPPSPTWLQSHLLDAHINLPSPQ